MLLKISILTLKNFKMHNMRPKLPFLLLTIVYCLLSCSSNAQILDAQIFGFEPDEGIQFNQGGIITTGNIIEAWEEEAGFSQTSEDKHTGSYCVKAVLSNTTDPLPKLNTEYAITGEGTFNLAADTYTGSIWVKIIGDKPKAIKATFDKPSDTPSLIFNLNDLTEADGWVEVTPNNPIIVTSATVSNSIRFAIQDVSKIGAGGGTLYFDDFNIVKDISTDEKSIAGNDITITNTTSNLKVEAPIKSRIYIYNTTGFLMHSIVTESNKTEFAISNYKVGIYIVKVVSDNSTYSKKIIKR